MVLPNLKCVAIPQGVRSKHCRESQNWDCVDLQRIQGRRDVRLMVLVDSDLDTIRNGSGAVELR